MVVEFSWLVSKAGIGYDVLAAWDWVLTGSETLATHLPELCAAAIPLQMESKHDLLTGAEALSPPLIQTQLF